MRFGTRAPEEILEYECKEEKDGYLAENETLGEGGPQGQEIVPHRPSASSYGLSSRGRRSSHNVSASDNPTLIMIEQDLPEHDYHS